MDFIRGQIGWVEVVCGPMFSGKSEELIRRLRRAREEHIGTDHQRAEERETARQLGHECTSCSTGARKTKAGGP